ncbi:MAG: metallopeptidase TldD-related protein [Thermoproteus sp.]
MMLKLVERLVDEAALVKVRAEHYMVRFANDEITAFKTWIAEEVSLYLAKDGRTTSISFTGEPDLKALDEALKRLPKLPQDPLYVRLRANPPAPREEREEDFERLADAVAEAIAGATGAERNAGAALLTYVRFEYEDTYGKSGKYAANRAYLTIRSFRGDLSATAATAARRIQELRPREAGAANAELLELAKGLPVRDVEPGRYRLLLSPLVFGHLMGEVASMWLTGLNVISGSSRYGPNDVGSAAASERLTLADVTADEGVYGFAPLDYEGNAAKRVELIRRGVLAGFLHNNKTAAKLGVETTGHALRGWFAPAPGHISVAPGDGARDLQGLLAELGDGYYLHNNWYTRYQNIKTGQFSTVGRDVALAVKGGRPVAVVRRMRIADTLEAVMKGIEALSSSAAQVYWWDMPVPATVPYALIADVGVVK